jgi:opacity protein-like surface antigen
MNSAAWFGLRRLLSQTILAACLSGLLASNAAAGGDVLRGGFVTTPTYWNWRGFYGGAQWNYNNADMDFSNATGSLVSQVLRNTSILGTVSGWGLLQNSSTTGNGWGGFVGYNWQWDDVVVGMEANYSRTSLARWSKDSMTRSFIDNTNAPPDHTYTYTVGLNGGGYVKLTDLATFRARAGWSFGALMPYGFIGFAVGRADVTTGVTVNTSLRDDYFITALCPDGSGGFVSCQIPQVANSTLPTQSQTTTQNGKWAYGGAFGLGFDWALTPNLFVRGEWEYVQLQKIEGIDLRLNTGRVGLGVKF